MSKKLIYLVSYVLLLGLAANIAEGADPSLVGRWKFDENGGTTATDSSGHGNDGIIYGATWTPDIFGFALQFDGIDDYVEAPKSVSLDDITSEITLTAWVNISTGTRQTILDRFLCGTVNERSFEFDIDSTGEVNFSLCGDGSVGDSVWLKSAGVVSPDTWTHLAAASDGTTMKIYINAVQDLNTEIPPSGIHVSAANLNIGRWLYASPNDWYYPFNGKLDEVRIYNRVLSENEIKKLAVLTNASKPSPADGALYPDIWATLSWLPGAYAVSHDVFFGENFAQVETGEESAFQGNQPSTFFVVGFPGFAYPDGLVPGTTYYWRIDEVNDNEPNSPWKGNVWSFGIPPKTAYHPDPADGVDSIDPNVGLSWTGGYGSKLHTVYFGESFDDVSNATGGQTQGTTGYDPGPLKLAKTYYWRVDEFDIVETHKGDVWNFTTEGAVESLDPANGAVDVMQTPVFTWVPGVYAASHQVYFGADKEAVKNADTSSPEYKGTRNLGSESYDAGNLEWDTTYYWRIDEVNNTNTDSPWTGPLWSFTTANFLVVDDFESYNDLDSADPVSNRIFLVWLDGFDNPAVNGSIVGYENPPFAEQSIVHGGNQSMPMSYDNAVGKSEATLTLTNQRDWTVNDVNTLTIWFRGEAANAAEPMYVALNDSAVVTNDNPDTAQKTSWTQWNIDLTRFADQGVNLPFVNSITLGLGNRSNPVAGGSGMMYFDDIRLYPLAP
jgi:hypothetical protein